MCAMSIHRQPTNQPTEKSSSAAVVLLQRSNALFAWRINCFLTMADRRRALGLRSGTVAAGYAPGKRAPLTLEERAHTTLNRLCRSLPTNKLISVPRNHVEAHCRADSMCALLGIPFCILGPLLLAAAILVMPKRGGALGFSSDGFETLVKLYNNKPSHKLCFLKKSLSEKSVERDHRMAGEPIT